MILSKEVQLTDLGEGELPESKVLDHLGLVAGMFEELEIGDRIDEHIAQDFEEREVSVGQAVKAMVLNGFGFVQQRLHLTPQFLRGCRPSGLSGKACAPKTSTRGCWAKRSTIFSNTESRSYFETWRAARLRSSG